MKNEKQVKKMRLQTLLNRLKQTRFHRAWIFFVVLVVCVVVSVVFIESGKVDPDVLSHNGVSVRPVTVVSVLPETYKSTIVSYGEVEPEWEVVLRSKVQGDVLRLSDQFRVGHTLKKDEIILEVNPTESEVLLADCDYRYQQAKVDLLVEERESKEAGSSWERAGLGASPESPLVLRQPYLKLARENLKSAEAALKQAREQLGFTRIQSPFDALVVERHVSIGGELFAGDPICKIIGIHSFVIPIHVDKGQWKQLPESWKNMSVDIVDPDQQVVWQGNLVRDAHFFDRETRLRTLYVAVNQPLQNSIPLLPGNFVEVRIRGRAISNLLKIPASARNQKGFVWFVTKDHLLESYEVVPEFRREGYIYVKNPIKNTAVVVVNPNNSFVNGLKVTPIEKE